MSQTLDGTQAGRTKRSLLFTWLLILAGFGFALVISWNFFTYVFGMQPTLAPEQVTTAGLAPHYGRLVTVSGGKSFATGLQMVSGEHVKYEYLILDTGSAWLLVRAQPTDAGRKEFTGTVEDVPRAVHSQMLAGIRRENADAPDPFLGYVLNANDFKREGWFGIAIGGISLGMALWSLYRSRR